MTAPRDYRDFLTDIFETCRSLLGFVAGMTVEQYLSDQKTRFAVLHGFEIIGEAVQHIPDAIKAANPDIPWGPMVAVRNRVVHAYFGIDDELLFRTIDEHLKPLLPRLEALAKQYGAAS